MSPASLPAARRVLFISYYSPPFGGPQGFRAAQFMTHLPTHGWQATLLTARAEAYGADPGPRDTSSFEGIRRGAIETRTLSVDAIVERVKGSPAAGTGSVEGGLAGSAGGGAAGGDGPYSLATRAAAILATPDRLAGWIPFAVAAGLRAARNADVIFAAGPPYSNHLVGVALARLAGRPLVVAVDDPWVSMSHRTWYSERQRRLHEQIEGAILRRAAGVVAATDGFGADVAARHPEANVGNNLQTSYYGYDAAALPQSLEPPAAPPVRFAYTGSLRGAQYDARGLLEALRRMARQDPRLGQRIRFDFYGSAEPGYEQLAADPLLAGVVRMHGFRPHREANEALARSHVAVLLIGDRDPEFSWYTSAKLFVYAGARKPILGLVPPGGEAARLIESRALGVLAAPSDPAGIAAAIEQAEHQHAALRATIGETADLDAAVTVGAAARAFERALSSPHS